MRSTNVNETSSRSHLIISFVLEYREKEGGEKKFGKICFIDLAGSERLALIGYDLQLYEEAIFINESLRYLGHVIRNLSLDQDIRLIKFEASLLTTLLKDTLGGASKTIMLCNISPS